MDTKKQVAISKETIEVFSSFTKVNTQLWITSGEIQSVIARNNEILFEAKIKENLSRNLLPDWGSERGFGIYKGDKFVEILKSLGKPVLDFSKINTASVLGILDQTNPKKKIGIEVVSPDEVSKKNNQFSLPDFDLEVRFSWAEINQMKKMGRRIEVVKTGKEAPCFRNIEPHNGTITENIITNYKPAKPFRFLFITEYLKMPQGDYKVSFSESGISEWVNRTDRRFIFYLALDEGCWHGKPKTPTELMKHQPKMKPVKDITSKEYKSITDYSKAVSISWRKGVDAIIETGELLSTAKSKFSKNERIWQSFINNLPFGIRTIEKLIYISKNKSILLDKRIYQNLPPSWGTLYEICTIGKDEPITIYENVEGETSQTKKKGFTEITMGKKDLILKAMDERISDEGKKVAPIRTDMTRKDIEVYKKKVAVKYFEAPKPKKEIPIAEPEPEDNDFFTILIKSNTPKKEVTRFEDKLSKLLKNEKWFELE